MPTAKRQKPVSTPIPDWWEAEFHDRQRRLRSQILRNLTRNGELVRGMLRVFSFSHDEHEHAIAVLVAEGSIVESTRSEPDRYGSTMMRSYTFYSLANRDD